MLTEEDWKKPFSENYLACADVLHLLEDRLMLIGLSGSDNFKRLQAEFIKHGAVTFRDMKRRAGE